MFGLSKSVSKLKSISSNKSINGLNENEIKVKKVKNKSKSNGVKRWSKGAGVAKGESVTKGVIMISNIPHGFYEKQMFEYFSQFGKVFRLRISRNKKTGRRRNYGFIEFGCEEVAKIAANTMNNYLMFDHILKCQFIPKTIVKEKPLLFKNWDKKQFIGSTQRHKSLHNKNKSIEREFKLLKKRLKRVKQMESHLKGKGLEFKCEVINLPDISKLRKDMKRDAIKASNMTSKTQMVKKSVKRRTEAIRVKKHLKETIKRRIFPKLFKYSIILSANKRKK